MITVWLEPGLGWFYRQVGLMEATLILAAVVQRFHLEPLPDLSRLPASAGPVEDAVARAAWEAMSPADQELVTQIYVNMGKAIAAPAGHSELEPLNLSAREMAQLIAFLRTLDGPIKAESRWLQVPAN